MFSFFFWNEGMMSTIAVQMFSFIRNWQNISQAGCTILHSHQQYMRIIHFFHIPTSIWCCHYFHFIHFDRCEGISLWFKCVFPECLIMWNIFSFACHLHICSQLSVQVFSPFSNWISFFLMLRFESSLYVLHTSPLSHMRWANMFSKSVDCLLHFLHMSFHRAEIFHFNEFQMITFSFYRSCLWC